MVAFQDCVWSLAWVFVFEKVRTLNDQLDRRTSECRRRKLIIFLPWISITVVMHKEKEENGMIHIHHSSHDSYRTRELGIFENGLLDADVFLQVSFLLISSTLSFGKNKNTAAICSQQQNDAAHIVEMCLNHSLIHFSFVIIFLPHYFTSLASLILFGWMPLTI